jgi:hypothetical protein
VNPRERFVVLGLAHARSPWFGEVARWATSAALPMEFLKCVSVEELRARLGSGRAFSAVLVDAGTPGVDRDLADLVRTTGAAVLVVDDGRARRDWSTLGASATLPAQFSRSDLLDALGTYAVPIGRAEATGLASPTSAAVAGWQGALVAVTGVAGAGTSTLAAALSQGLGDDARNAGMVVLADLALHADQAVLHDAGDVAPGLPELVDAHRMGLPSIDDVRSLTFTVTDRGYALLLGLRRHRDWASLRPRSLEASLSSLRRAYRVVVADVEGDLEGENQCGSVDVEDRNLLARTAVATASVVVVVGHAGPKGVHATVRLLGDVLEHGVAPGRIVTVVNRAPRNPRQRAELTRALAELGRALPGGSKLGSPVFVPERRRIDDLVRDGHRLPASCCTAVTSAVGAALAADPVPGPVGPDAEPVAVTPGSLGSWSDVEEF